MRAGELLLRHVALEQRQRALNAEIEHLEAQLASDPELERLAAEMARLEEESQGLALRLREAERQAEAERARMLGRDRELMSGRIRDPAELTKMSQEVEHMKSRVAAHEDAELALMEETEALDKRSVAAAAALQAAGARVEAEAPTIRARLASARTDLATVEAERDQAWAQVPAAYQAEYRRLRMQPPVAVVVDGKCGVCHVTVTSNGMQLLRRDQGFVHCDNCGRLLVVV